MATKGAGGGKNSCTDCSGKGYRNTKVQRRIPPEETADGKEQIVTEQVRVDCVKCGGEGTS